jgi:hypothetical protein
MNSKPKDTKVFKEENNDDKESKFMKFFVKNAQIVKESETNCEESFRQKENESDSFKENTNDKLRQIIVRFKAKTRI